VACLECGRGPLDVVLGICSPRFVGVLHPTRRYINQQHSSSPFQPRLHTALLQRSFYIGPPPVAMARQYRDLSEASTYEVAE
jgi:hypothetical protein